MTCRLVLRLCHPYRNCWDGNVGSRFESSMCIIAYGSGSYTYMRGWRAGCLFLQIPPYLLILTPYSPLSPPSQTSLPP